MSFALYTSVVFVPEAVPKSTPPTQPPTEEVVNHTERLAKTTAIDTAPLIQSDTEFEVAVTAISNAYADSLIPLNGLFLSFTDAVAAQYDNVINAIRSLFKLIISLNGNITDSSVAAIESVVRKLSESVWVLTASVNDLVVNASSTVTEDVGQFIVTLTGLFGATLQIVNDNLGVIGAFVSSELFNGFEQILQEELKSVTNLYTIVSGVGDNSSVKSIIATCRIEYATINSNVRTAVTALIGGFENNPGQSM